MEAFVVTLIGDLIRGYANSRGLDPEGASVQLAIEDASVLYRSGGRVSAGYNQARQQLGHSSADLMPRSSGAPDGLDR